MLAAGKGHLDVCRVLIAAGAGVNGQDNQGQTPLMLAAAKGYLDVCRTLIEAGAGINGHGNQGPTPLMLAAAKGHLDVCRALIGAGAGVNGQDSQGQTPLMLAAAKGLLDVCRLLVEAGADVQGLDNDGRSALTHCARNLRLRRSKDNLNKWIDVAEYLIRTGADVTNREGEHGNTALSILRKYAPERRSAAFYAIPHDWVICPSCNTGTAVEVPRSGKVKLIPCDTCDKPFEINYEGRAKPLADCACGSCRFFIGAYIFRLIGGIIAFSPYIMLFLIGYHRGWSWRNHLWITVAAGTVWMLSVMKCVSISALAKKGKCRKKQDGYDWQGKLNHCCRFWK